MRQPADLFAGQDGCGLLLAGVERLPMAAHKGFKRYSLNRSYL